MITAGDSILKTDTKDRVRTPRERQESLLDEFERSGLSGAKFAEFAESSIRPLQHGSLEDVNNEAKARPRLKARTRSGGWKQWCATRRRPGSRA